MSDNPGRAALLHIERFCLGEWMTNCYVVHFDQAAGDGPKDCWIVDAGFAPEPMIRYIQDNGLSPKAVVLTHGHVDHIAGVNLVREEWPEVPILIHEAEERFLTKPLLNLSVLMTPTVIAPQATGLLRHGQSIELGGVPFEVRHTPGHSPGGVSLYQPDAGVVFVGDALFAQGVGRTDFLTSDSDALLESIRSQLYNLPDDTHVLPGHGPATTIGRERRGNPFVTG